MGERETAIQELHSNTEKLLAEINAMPEAKLTETFLGTWSVREILVHIAGWDNILGEAMERMGRGERPAPEGVNLGDTDGMNASFVEQAKGKSVPAIRKDLETGMARLEAGAKALPEDRFEGDKTAMRLLRGMAGHPAEHIDQIRTFKAGQTGA